MRADLSVVWTLQTLPSNLSVAGHLRRLCVPTTCGPNHHSIDQQNPRSMVHGLNSKDDKGGDGLDLKSFGDVCLLLGFHLKSKDRIA